MGFEHGVKNKVGQLDGKSDDSETMNWVKGENANETDRDEADERNQEIDSKDRVVRIETST